MNIMHKPFTSRQSGMSLIEIMVAVVVVSIGLLGVARMEILAKQSNVEAIQRTTATQLAQQIIEKMRANPGQLPAYVGQVLGAGTLTKPSPTCDSTTCTTAQLAAWDLYQWDQALIGANEVNTKTSSKAGGLDSPRGCIAGPGGAGAYTIAIVWRGKTPMKNPTSTTCGNNLGLYGTNEEYRRVLVVNLYISDDGV